MEYSIQGQVGLGTFGKVYRAVHVQTNEQVALKMIKMESEREGFPVTAVREIKLLTLLDHPNLIKLRRVYRSPDDQIFLVFDYFAYDLVGLMRCTTLTTGDCKCVMRAVLCGLAYLHAHHILHRDVKPSNVLVDGQARVCLGDFGLAKQCFSPTQPATTRPLTNRVVTLWYRAPELLLGATRYDGGVDVWAAGCILWELVAGHSPFTGSDEFQVLDSIASRLGGFPSSPHLPWATLVPAAHAPPETALPGSRDCRDLLGKMLRIDPRERISAQQALQHRFFADCPPRVRIDAGQPSLHEFEVRKKY